jgi:chemotaxis protein histidine kinase CheA
MTFPDSMQRAISDMRPRFIAALAERLITMNEARATIAAAGPLPQSLRTIQFLAHKTSGVAATLGFEAMGKLTAHVDAGVDAFLKAPDDPTHRDALIAAIDRMIAAITVITQEGQPSEPDA